MDRRRRSLAADSIRSDVRRQIAERDRVKDRSVTTGDAACRVVIPQQKMQGDERALALLESNVGMS